MVITYEQFLTGAWIVTGGTGTGVMDFVGEAVRDHLITFGKRDNIVALGISTWGAVADNAALDGDDVRYYLFRGNQITKEPVQFLVSTKFETDERLTYCVHGNIVHKHIPCLVFLIF
jgi:hypothetical protein